MAEELQVQIRDLNQDALPLTLTVLITNLIEAVGRIAPDQWDAVIGRLTPILGRFTDAQTIIFILHTVSNIAPDQKVDVIHFADAFLQGNLNFFEASQILLAIESIAPMHREEVVGFVTNYVAQTPGVHDIPHLLRNPPLQKG